MASTANLVTDSATDLSENNVNPKNGATKPDTYSVVDLTENNGNQNGDAKKAADLAADSDLSKTNGNPKSDEKKPFKMNFKERFDHVREAITIEPLLCFYVLAAIVCVPAIRNLQLEMACFVNKGYDDTVCAAILNDNREEDTWNEQSGEVNTAISDMYSWSTPFQSFLPAIYLIFLGTFSDRHKIRKPFLLIPIVGEFFSCICCIFCVIFRKSWPVEVEGVAQMIVPSVFGGIEMVGMAAFAYISDVSPPEKRVARIAMLQLCLSIGAPIGHFCTALLFPVLGYIGSLILGFVFFLLALIYGAIKVKEPMVSTEEISTKSLIADMFNPRHAIETFKLLVNAKGEQRKNLIFILSIFCISALIDGGEGSLFSNLANQAYGWDGTDEAYYGTALGVLNLMAFGVGIPVLANIFRLHDLQIVAIAFADKIISSIVILSVLNQCGLYMGIVAGILSITALTGLNSQMTKYVSEDDTGKILSLAIVVGVIGRTIGLQIYTQAIWPNTLKRSPQAFYFLGIALLIPTILALIWKYFQEKNKPIEVPVAENGTAIQKTEPKIESSDTDP